MWKLDADGYLVDEEGNRVQIEEQDVQIDTGELFTQGRVNKIVQERLARQKETIVTLEEAAKQNPALQEELQKAKEELTSLQSEKDKADDAARQRVATQLGKAQKRAEEAEAALEREQKAHVRTELTNSIMEHAGIRFRSPKRDVVPQLLVHHKREPQTDESGKPIEGQEVDLFEIEVISEDGKKSSREWLPVDEALDAFAAHPDNAHYLEAQNRGGGGGSQTRDGGKQPSAITRLAQLKTPEEKAAFIKKEGKDAHRRLVDQSAEERRSAMRKQAGKTS